MRLKEIEVHLGQQIRSDGAQIADVVLHVASVQTEHEQVLSLELALLGADQFVHFVRIDAVVGEVFFQIVQGVQIEIELV